MTFTAVYTWPSLETDFTLTTYTKNDATTVETTFDGARAPDLAFLTWVHRKKHFKDILDLHCCFCLFVCWFPFLTGLY
jgi:hypothetical protein